MDRGRLASRFLVASAACVGLLGACGGGAEDHASAIDVDGDGARVHASSARLTTAACAPTPHPKWSARDGVYCPGTPPTRCAVGEHCCVGRGHGASTCVPESVACADPRAKDWGCTDPSDCPAGTVCCGDGQVSPGACDLTVSRFHATRCAAACGPGQFALCQTSSQCAGATCVSATACNAPLGVCR